VTLHIFWIIVMDNELIKAQAQSIIGNLKGYTWREVVLILSEAFSLIASQQQEVVCESPGNAGYLFRVRTGKKAKIDKDPEILFFLYGIDRYMTLYELQDLLIEKFGKKRAPSKSALWRYFKNNSTPLKLDRK